MIYTLGDAHIETASEQWYVAPSAAVIGRVRFGVHASVWFNCVLRGDSDWIVLGDQVNVQDGSIIHTDPGVPVELGAGASVGHGVILHGCTIGEGSLIGNGAIVLDGARIGRRCLIAAGTLVPPGKAFADGSVLMGSPAKVVRQVEARDLAMMAHTTAHYVARIPQYREHLLPDARHR